MSDADVPAAVAACQDPAIQRYTHVPSPYGEKEARDWLAEQASVRSGEVGLHLLIVDESDRLLGSVGLVAVDWEDRRASIGYWVAREARGRGVATRAVRLLARWAFDDLELGRLEIRAEPENVASCTVAERSGFSREGLLRSYSLLKGRRRDMLIYSLLPSELR